MHAKISKTSSPTFFCPLNCVYLILCFSFASPNTYTVTFNPNGGSITGVSTTIEQTYNSKYSLIASTNVSKPGYNFVGWFTAASGGEEVTTDTTVTITTAQTLYAHWTAKTDMTYYVKHYVMNTNGEYVLLNKLYTAYAGEETLTDGTTGKVVSTDTLKNTTFLNAHTNGIVYSSTKLKVGTTEVQSSVIPETGNLTIEFYYSRNTFTVTTEYNEYITSVTGAGTYYYEKEVTLTASLTTYETCEITGWKLNGNEIENVKAETYTFRVQATNMSFKVYASISVEKMKLGVDLNTSSHTATITSYNAKTDDARNITIPTVIGGRDASSNAVTGYTYEVTAIGENAFIGKPIKSVSVPRTVGNIGNYAFADCAALKTIELKPETLSIGKFAFCKDITGVINSREVYGKSLFADKTEEVIIATNRTVYINSEAIANNVIGSAATSNPTTGSYDYGNIMVGVSTIYVNANLTVGSTFITQYFTKADGTEDYKGITYTKYTRKTSKTYAKTLTQTNVSYEEQSILKTILY